MVTKFSILIYSMLNKPLSDEKQTILGQICSPWMCIFFPYKPLIILPFLYFGFPWAMKNPRCPLAGLLSSMIWVPSGFNFRSFPIDPESTAVSTDDKVWQDAHCFLLSLDREPALPADTLGAIPLKYKTRRVRKQQNMPYSEQKIWGKGNHFVIFFILAIKHNVVCTQWGNSNEFSQHYGSMEKCTKWSLNSCRYSL